MKLMSRSLRVRVTLWIVLPLIVILGMITAVEYTRYRHTVLSNASVLASHSGQVIESSLRHAMLESDFDEVQAVLNTMGAMHEFRIVYLIDTEGTVIFAPGGEGVGNRLDHNSDECQSCHRLEVGDRPSSVIITAPDGERVFRSMQPIENSPECMQCHPSEERLLGLLLTDLSMAPLEKTLREDLYEHFVWWGMTIASTVLVVNLVLNRFVLSRLEQLAVAIRRFGQNQWPPPVPDPEPDEIGQLSIAFHTMEHQVQARSEENRRLSDDLSRQSAMRGELLKRLITAQEDERRRLAREIHDDLGQAVSGLSFQMEALQGMIAADPVRAREQLGPIRALIGETTERMYQLIHDLRPSVLDDLGLEAALSAHAGRVLRQRGIEFQLDTSGLDRRLPAPMETTLYRVFQEAMHNIVRHAGASEVTMTLSLADGILHASIRDDGCGFDPASVKVNGHGGRGLGLLGMSERVAQCGGEIGVITQPGQGTEITIRIPLEEGAHCE